jgi:hypothetical protein
VTSASGRWRFRHVVLIAAAAGVAGVGLWYTLTKAVLLSDDAGEELVLPGWMDGVHDGRIG